MTLAVIWGRAEWRSFELGLIRFFRAAEIATHNLFRFEAIFFGQAGSLNEKKEMSITCPCGKNILI
jgi:hypothetical protein